MDPELYFYWYDYTIFFIVLGISASIGIYFGFFGTKQASLSEYLMGNKNMNYLPVGLSIAVSHFSAITLVAVPADAYRYGAFYLLTCLSMVLLTIIVIYVFLPVFFERQPTSIYEYLEKRFDKKTRLLVSFLYVIIETLTSSVIIYSPSLALSTATGFNVHAIAFVISSVCIFYTAVGGLKTVIWTDLFQFVTIVLSLIIIYIIGVWSEGGFLKVWNTAVEGGRLDIFDFNLDPTRRDSFWIYVVGYTIHYLNYIGLSQAGMQKFLTLKTFKDCVKSATCNVIAMSLVSILCVFTGLTMYSKYLQCDPLLSKKVTRYDQLVSYYIQDITKNIPGISGLFFAALCSGALSTLSCSLNAISGIVYKDFVSRFLSRTTPERTTTNILKLIVVITGFIATFLIPIMKHLGEAFGLVVSIGSLVSGPILGLFTLGVLFPQANAKGALFGSLADFICLASLTIPNKYYYYQGAIRYPTKQLNVFGCDNNFTTPSNSSIILDQQNFEEAPFLFRISHFYDCFIGALATIIFGLIISYVTCEEPRRVNQMLIAPFLRHSISEESQNDRHVLSNLLN